MKASLKLFALISATVYLSSAIAKESPAEHKAPKSNDTAHSSHHESKAGVSPDQALGWLKNGNSRFLKGSLRKDGQSKTDIHRLSSGQTPHTIILSCSDSRVPPEIVFDQKLGELFTVRTAGEALDSNVIGSIEYAVEHLGAKLIVVMGHTSCGAVKAALGTMNGGDAGSKSLNELVKDLHPRLQSFSKKQPSKDVKEESWANAEGVSNDLISRSEILKKKLEAGEIKIVTSLYHLDSGHVDFKN